jgi:type I restriction enzyme, S subunit
VKVGWKKLPFDEAIADASGGNLKTPQSEFLDEGEFAVVDQGQELVAGYVNDRTRLCRSPLPVVVFGDHTRCFKFVDFPFCMGADGVKVLRPRVDADVKYLYHFLRQVRLYDGGYDRHFKYLKRAEVVLPPLEEQRRIAEVLDRAEALRAKRRSALAELDSLTQSLFLDLFGDPATNPKGWPKRELEDVCEAINDCPHSTPAWTDAGVICLRTSNLTAGGWNWEDTRYVSEATYHERSKRGYIAVGDIVLSREGTVGIAAVVKVGMTLCMGQRLVQVRSESEALNSEFLLRHLLYMLDPLRIGQVMVGSTSQHLNVKELRALRIPLPPIELQREFARRVGVVEKLKTAQSVSLAELEALFASLQTRAFKGEL